MCDLAIDEGAGNPPHDLTVVFERSIGDRAHLAYACATVHQPDIVLGKHPPKRSGCFDVCGPVPTARTAEHTDAHTSMPCREECPRRKSRRAIRFLRRVPRWAG